jgi:hypothetical protein
LARDGERPLEIRFRFRFRFRFRPVRLRQHQRDFASYAIDLGLAPSFLGCFHRRYRFANAAPSVIEQPKLGMGPRQM